MIRLSTILVLALAGLSTPVAAAPAKMSCANNLKQLGLAANAAEAECRSLASRQVRGRTATQVDVSRLTRLPAKPSVKCARIEYIHQCLSVLNMTLVRTRCRAGSTEASCCKAARDYVNSNICGPLWAKLKALGVSYHPGIFTCKCIEQPARRLRPERSPIRGR